MKISEKTYTHIQIIRRNFQCLVFKSLNKIKYFFKKGLILKIGLLAGKTPIFSSIRILDVDG